MSDEDRPLKDDATAEGRKRGEPRRSERGDATLGRIADLAGGWSVGDNDPGSGAGEDGSDEAERTAAAASARARPSAPPPPRSAPRTAPPPPPKTSTERRGLPSPTGAPPSRTSSPTGPVAAATAAGALPPLAATRPSSPPAPAPRPEAREARAEARPAARSELPEPKPELKADAKASAKPGARPDPKLDPKLDPRADAKIAAALELKRPGKPTPIPVSDDEDDDDPDSIIVPIRTPHGAPPAAAAAAKAAAAAPPGVRSGATVLLSDVSGESIDIDTDDEDSIFGVTRTTATSAATAAAKASRDSSPLFVLPTGLSSSAPPWPDDDEPAAPSSKAATTAAVTVAGPTPPPAAARAAPATPPPAAAAAAKAPPAAPSPSSASATGANATVPVGEFEPTGDPRELRRKLPEGKTRDGEDEIAVTESRGDPTMIDSSHLRSDATELREAKANVADAGIAATLRHAPSLPRRRGVWGDLRYVFTVWLGTRRARRELRRLDLEQLEREKDRRRHLTTIGRAAATSAELDQTQIRRTRDSLGTVDRDRSSHAAQVGASDAEMEQVRRERAAKAAAHRDEIEALELEQAQLLQKLEPLQKESAAARRRATDLRNDLVKLDGRIANVEAGRGKWADATSAAAELAALRAEREGVARDEPVIAAQLDSLVPRIAGIEASRERLRRKVAERNEEEEEDARRSDELLSAIAAKRKVVERATADAEKARERMLAELGERLYVDRPRSLAAHLSPLDSLDLELGDIQRRMMELREILASVDRWKLARGIALWTLIAAVIGAGIWFYLQGQLPLLPPP